MSRIEFIMSGKEPRILLEHKYTVGMAVDITGQPSSLIRTSLVTMSFQSGADNRELEAMLLKPARKFSARIIYYSGTDESPLKELQITDAYITEFHEFIDARLSLNNKISMITNLTISASSLTLGGKVWKSDWAE